MITRVIESVCVLLLLLVSTTISEAKHAHRHNAVVRLVRYIEKHEQQHQHLQISLGAVSPRPSNCYGIAWCGCYVRTQVSRDPGPEGNLAAFWEHFGHPSSLAPGAIVVRRGGHHVEMVQAVYGDGTYLARGGNVRRDNMVHTYLESTSGIIAIRAE